jgi:2Fe-2S ferredoxin
MPKVTVLNLHSKTIDCHLKTKKLLDILLSETDWMHSCGGKGRCTTCSAVIITGQENLSTLTDVELKYQKLGKITVNMRLSCQCLVEGDVEIKTPKTYQLPHLKYS